MSRCYRRRHRAPSGRRGRMASCARLFCCFWGASWHFGCLKQNRAKSGQKKVFCFLHVALKKQKPLSVLPRKKRTHFSFPFFGREKNALQRRRGRAVRNGLRVRRWNGRGCRRRTRPKPLVARAGEARLLGGRGEKVTRWRVGWDFYDDESFLSMKLDGGCRLLQLVPCRDGSAVRNRGRINPPPLSKRAEDLQGLPIDGVELCALEVH